MGEFTRLFAGNRIKLGTHALRTILHLCAEHSKTAHQSCGSLRISAVDGYGDVDEKPSSDTLQALLYIPPEIAAKHLPRNYRELVQSYMQQLETEFGYRANIPAKDGEGGVDPYHTYVWIYQNAELHAASVLHGLDAPKEVAQRSRALIDPADGIYPECADEGGNITGNVWQLWTMAAYLYFCHPERSFTIPKPK